MNETIIAKVLEKITKFSTENYREFTIAVATKYPEIFLDTPMNINEHREKIISLLKEGQKIDAIKHYRAVYNSGLKEAKDAVEQIQSDLGLI